MNCASPNQYIAQKCKVRSILILTLHVHCMIAFTYKIFIQIFFNFTRGSLPPE